MAKETIQQYQIVTGLYAASWAISNPILVLFLLSRGLSLGETGLYFAFFRLVSLGMEVPTGAFADAYGRRKSVMMAFLCSIFGFGAFLFVHDLGLLILSGILIGSADAFFSGAMESWAVDRLKEEGVEKTHTQSLLANGVGALYGVLLVGSVIGGYVGAWSYEAAIALGFPAMLVGIWYVNKLPERTERRTIGASMKRIWQKMSQTMQRCVKDEKLLSLLLISLLFGAGCFRLFVAWQPAFAQLFGWGAAESGWLFAAISVAVILGAKTTVALRGWKITLWQSLFGMGVFVVLSAIWWNPWPTLLCVLLFEMMNGMEKPIMNNILHQRTPSTIRATVISLSAGAFSAGFGLMGVGLALVGEMSISESWIWSGTIFLMAAGLAWKEGF